jgi:hypothetical protein
MSCLLLKRDLTGRDIGQHMLAAEEIRRLQMGARTRRQTRRDCSRGVSARDCCRNRV